MSDKTPDPQPPRDHVVQVTDPDNPNRVSCFDARRVELVELSHYPGAAGANKAMLNVTMHSGADIVLRYRHYEDAKALYDKLQDIMKETR